jgi:uncharacterized alkaline shock family protein YloU
MTEGKTTIAPEVLQSIARLATLQISGVSRLFDPNIGVNRLIKRKLSEGVHVEIRDNVVYTDLYVVLNHDIDVREISKNIQLEVARAFSDLVDMSVGSVNVHIEDIDYPINHEE